VGEGRHDPRRADLVGADARRTQQPGEPAGQQTERSRYEATASLSGTMM
jgi:hypothetical protein